MAFLTILGRGLLLLGRVLLLLLSGMAVGWLVGLSSSPIIASVMPPVLALALGGATILAGLRTPDAEPTDTSRRRHHATKVLVYPIGAITVGIALGATLGLWTKAADALAPKPQVLIDRWASKEVGLDRKAVAQRLFDRTEPDPAWVKTESPKGDTLDAGTKDEPAKPKGSTGAALGAARTSQLLNNTASDRGGCLSLLQEMKGKDISSLRGAMDTVGVSFAPIGKMTNDPDKLRQIIEIVCHMPWSEQ
jgi:hypothetical protein